MVALHWWLLVLLLDSSAKIADACLSLKLRWSEYHQHEKTSQSIGQEDRIFEQVPLDSLHSDFLDSGRPVYISRPSTDTAETLYLFFLFPVDRYGHGHWILSRTLQIFDIHEPKSQSDIIAYVRSWSILPHLIMEVSDAMIGSGQGFWRSPGKDTAPYKIHSWPNSPNLQFICTDDSPDSAIYFEGSVRYSLETVGFYVKRIATNWSSPVYSHIIMKAEDRPLYLFEFITNEVSRPKHWLIGRAYGEDSAEAFVPDNAATADQITGSWFFVHKDQLGNPWVDDERAKVIGSRYYPKYMSIYQILRDVRRIDQRNQAHQLYLPLRNTLLMPAVGLGTGGIYKEDSYNIFHDALELGYRLYDMAREYDNEYIMGDVLRDIDPAIVSREQVFLETKVWPTNFGFVPTTNEIIKSLVEFDTTYVDMYLLHWPR